MNRSLWGNRDFLILWLGQALSVLGSAISRVAIPWLVLDLTGSAAHAGAMTAVGFVFYMVLALPSGVWVDRFDRRRIMIGADIARTVFMGSVPVAALFGSVSVAHLYVVQAVTASASALFDMGYVACLPNLVRKDQLQAANSRIQGTEAFAAIAGPAIGGVLIGAVGSAATVSFDSLSFLASVATLLAIRRPFQATTVRPAETATASGDRDRKEAFWPSLVGGVRFVLRTPVLRSLIVVSVLLNLSAGLADPVELFRMKQELGFVADVVGLVFAVGGAGALVGALFSGAVSRRLPLGRIILTGFGGFVAGGVLLATARSPLGFMTAGALRSVSAVLVNVQSLSVRQAVTPDHLQGRSTAAFRTIAWGLGPPGNIVGGFAGQNWGAVPVLWVSAAVMVVALGVVVGTGLFRLASPGKVGAPAEAGGRLGADDGQVERGQSLA